MLTLTRTPTRLQFAAVYWAVGAVSLVWIYQANAWLLTHWMFNYPEVMRRALPGTVLEPFGVTRFSVLVAGLVAYVAAVGLVGWGLAGLTEGEEWRQRFWTAIVLVASPAGFPFLAANMSRTDTWLVVGFVVAVWLIQRRRFVAVFVVVVAMMLTHEAALLLAVAWLVAWMWVEGHSRPAVTTGLLGVLLAGGLMAWTPSVGMDAYMASVANPYFPIHPGSVGVLYNKDGNIWFAIRDFFSVRGGLRLAEVLALTAPVWPAIWGLRDRWLIAGSAAPLLLIGVGIDYERWFPFALGLAMVSVLLAGGMQPVRRLQWLAAGSVGLTVLVGGLIHG